MPGASGAIPLRRQAAVGMSRARNQRESNAYRRVSPQSGTGVMWDSSIRRSRLVALVATLSFCVPGAPIVAQSDSTLSRVSGVVGDAQTGMAIPNALVAIPDLGIRTLADANGHFHIDRVPTGSYTWLFLAPGYAVWSEPMAVDDGEHLRVGLLPQPVVLETIVATANRLVERRKTTGLGVRALSWAEIQSTTATNAAQVVTARSPYPVVNCPGSMAGPPPQPVASNQHPSRVTPRRERASTGGADAVVGLCLSWRGKIISPQIYLDEQLTPVPLDVLYQFMPHEIHTIEYYQHPGRGTVIRIYTLDFMRSGKALLPSSSLFR